MEAGPVLLHKIDEEMCEYMGAPVDDDKWCLGWYDSTGLRLACGDSFEKIKADYRGYIEEYEAKDEHDMVEFYTLLNKATEWLDEHFTPNSWHEVGNKR